MTSKVQIDVPSTANWDVMVVCEELDHSNVGTGAWVAREPVRIRPGVITTFFIHDSLRIAAVEEQRHSPVPLLELADAKTITINEAAHGHE